MGLIKKIRDVLNYEGTIRKEDNRMIKIIKIKETGLFSFEMKKIEIPKEHAHLLANFGKKQIEYK